MYVVLLKNGTIDRTLSVMNVFFIVGLSYFGQLRSLFFFVNGIRTSVTLLTHLAIFQPAQPKMKPTTSDKRVRTQPAPFVIARTTCLSSNAHAAPLSAATRR